MDVIDADKPPAADAPVAPSEHTFDLRKPIELGELKYSRITLREPTAGEIMESDQPGMASTVHLISLVSGMVPMAVEKLCARDWFECDEWIRDFLPGGRWIGATA